MRFVFRLPSRPLPVRASSANTPRSGQNRPVEPIISGPAPSLTAALNVVSAPQTPATGSRVDQPQQREKVEILKRLNEKMMPEKDTPSNVGKESNKSKWSGAPNDFTFSDVAIKPESTMHQGTGDSADRKESPAAIKK